eukprot:10241676-Lingulodinium_polyedra.AAC.1
MDGLMDGGGDRYAQRAEVREYADRSVDRTIDESVDRSIHQSTDGPINRRSIDPIDPSIER